MRKPLDLIAAKAHKAELSEFFLDLSSWRKFKTRYGLKWEKLAFSNASKTQVPKARGIYTFTVELTPSKLPAHGYIVYIGIAGVGAKSNLRERFDSYLRSQRTGHGRPKVVYMLLNWKEDLQFNFAPLSDPKACLKTIETALLDAVRPPANSADFSPEVTAVRKAF